MKTDSINRKKLGKLKSVICDFFEMPYEELSSKSRERDFVIPRHFFHYLARKHTIASYSLISSYTNRDHATVINSCKAIQNYIDTKDSIYISILEKLEVELSDTIVVIKTNGLKTISHAEFVEAILRKQIQDISRIEDHVKSDFSMQGFNKRKVLELVLNAKKSIKLLEAS